MKEITITKDNSTTHRLINSDFLKVEDHKSWIEQLEEAINSPEEVVPEINSLEDLNKWLSDSRNISKKLILDKDNDKR